MAVKKFFGIFGKIVKYMAASCKERENMTDTEKLIIQKLDMLSEEVREVKEEVGRVREEVGEVKKEAGVCA